MSFRSEKISKEMMETLPPKKHLFYTNGLMLIIGALLVLTSWNISDRPWEKLGVRLPDIDYNVITLSFLVIMLYLLDGIYGWINRKHHEDSFKDLQYVIPVNWQEYRHYIFLAFSAGICEEIIFRGFLITYLSFYFSDISNGNIFAIIIPAIVFSVSHLYQGWWAVLKILVLAVFFGFIFMYSGSLVLVIIIHILIDLISGIMGMVNQPGNSDRTV